MMCEHCGERRHMCCSGRVAAEARAAALAAKLKEAEHLIAMARGTHRNSLEITAYALVKVEKEEELARAAALAAKLKVAREALEAIANAKSPNRAGTCLRRVAAVALAELDTSVMRHKSGLNKLSETEIRARAGAAIRTIRQELGLTLGQASRALLISVVRVSEVERGKRRLDRSTLKDWLLAFATEVAS